MRQIQRNKEYLLRNKLLYGVRSQQRDGANLEKRGSSLIKRGSTEEDR